MGALYASIYLDASRVLHCWYTLFVSVTNVEILRSWDVCGHAVLRRAYATVSSPCALLREPTDS